MEKAKVIYTLHTKFIKKKNNHEIRKFLPKHMNIEQFGNISTSPN